MSWVRDKKSRVEWVDETGYGGHWEVTGGQIVVPIKVTNEELWEDFLIFAAAATVVSKMKIFGEMFDDEMAILGCAAMSLSEIVPRQQRYQVHRAIALLFGYKDRTELPTLLEEAVKKTWFEEGEEFEGF